MKSLLRRNLLLLMLGATAAAFTINIQTPAFAKNGSDDGSSSSSSSSGSSGSGSSSSSGSSDDNSGSGGGDDDNSGSGSGGDDNSGSGRDRDSDDDNSSGGSSSDDNSSNDDSNNRSASNVDRMNGGGGGNRANRPRVQISVDAATRAALLNGTLVAVDNLGRPLEVEVEDGGVLIAKPHGGDAKRKPGPIASFNVVPAAQAPVHQ
jgi:hypothetical protein